MGRLNRGSILIDIVHRLARPEGLTKAQIGQLYEVNPRTVDGYIKCIRQSPYRLTSRWTAGGVEVLYLPTEKHSHAHQELCPRSVNEFMAEVSRYYHLTELTPRKVGDSHFGALNRSVRSLLSRNGVLC